MVGQSSKQSPEGQFAPSSDPQTEKGMKHAEADDHLFNIYDIARSHALSINDGSHLICEEGLDLWVKHFAEADQNTRNNFEASITISWFNFIINLLLTADKFDWSLKLLKSHFWQILTTNLLLRGLFYLPHS